MAVNREGYKSKKRRRTPPTLSILSDRMLFSPCGQDERQYKQPGQQHTRDK